MDSQTQTRDKKILAAMRAVMRLRHFAVHAARSFGDWMHALRRFQEVR